MQNDPPTIEDLIMPSLEISSDDEELGLTEKAIEVAETQAVLRDVLSATIGNLFAFFAMIFPPLIASTIELTAKARGKYLEENSNNKLS